MVFQHSALAACRALRRPGGARRAGPDVRTNGAWRVSGGRRAGTAAAKVTYVTLNTADSAALRA